MYKSFNPGMVGIQANLFEAIELAGQAGFGGVDLGMRAVADVIDSVGAECVLERFAAARVRPGACGILPGRVSVSQDEWSAGLTELPRLCGLAQRLGYTRAGIVALPFHETLGFAENLELHVRRLRQVAPVLADHGLSLGCEYVSQKTRRAPYPHAFVYDMKGMLELLAATGFDNLGLLFDTFHWYCAAETLADIRVLQARQVVAVHASDAPKGRALDEHVAFERALPGETGLIDLKGVYRALAAIGYDGPLTCEPCVNLGALPPAEAAAKVSAALDTMIAD
jgi:sugar phosphate isomerase/epimerase